MAEKVVSCDSCVHSLVCRLLEGERDASFSAQNRGDIIKEVNTLKMELAQACRFYKMVKIDG